MPDDLGLLVTAAQDAADAASQHSDYRAQYVHVGRGLIYALAALSQSVDRFAEAVKPKEETP